MNMERLSEIYATLSRIEKEFSRTLDLLRHSLIEANQEIMALRQENEKLKAKNL